MTSENTTNERFITPNVVFALYGISIFVFSVIYYWVFKSDPKSFAFNADIRYAQAKTVAESVKDEVAQLTKEIPSLIELQHSLAARTSFDSTTNDLMFPRVEFIFSSNYSYQFSDDRKKRHDKAHSITVKAYDSTNTLIFRHMLPFMPILTDKGKIARYRDYAFSFLLDVQQTIQKRESQLATFASPNPDVWSFWDFAYFSTITQTTVGYGDMLPNCTLVRMLVMLQLFISSGLLIVVLNLVGHDVKQYV